MSDMMSAPPGCSSGVSLLAPISINRVNPEPHPPADSPRDHIVVVLWETQDLVNIAGTIRAMKNFGLSHLRLVAPAEWDPWRIEGIAHDTTDIVAKVELFDDLPAALADREDVFASTAPAQAQSVSAGMFGAGFTLRLARAEARAAGGDLTQNGETLILQLPLSLGTSGDSGGNDLDSGDPMADTA